MKCSIRFSPIVHTRQPTDLLRKYKTLHRVTMICVCPQLTTHFVTLFLFWRCQSCMSTLSSSPHEITTDWTDCSQTGRHDIEHVKPAFSCDVTPVSQRFIYCPEAEDILSRTRTNTYFAVAVVNLLIFSHDTHPSTSRRGLIARNPLQMDDSKRQVLITHTDNSGQFCHGTLHATAKSALMPNQTNVDEFPSNAPFKSHHFLWSGKIESRNVHEASIASPGETFWTPIAATAVHQSTFPQHLTTKKNFICQLIRTPFTHLSTVNVYDHLWSWTTSHSFDRSRRSTWESVQFTPVTTVTKETTLDLHASGVTKTLQEAWHVITKQHWLIGLRPQTRTKTIHWYSTRESVSRWQRDMRTCNFQSDQNNLRKDTLQQNSDELHGPELFKRFFVIQNRSYFVVFFYVPYLHENKKQSVLYNSQEFRRELVEHLLFGEHYQKLTPTIGIVILHENQSVKHRHFDWRHTLTSLSNAESTVGSKAS